jgi:hypothetical protein
MINKKGQDEMVGFAIIIIIIGVIILIAIGFLVNTREENAIQDYEIESFIESSLQYTTDCQDSLGFISIRELIIECSNNNLCLGGNSSCYVLNYTLSRMIKKGWTVSPQSSIKAYEFFAMADNQSIIMFKEGNKTADYKSGIQSFARSGVEYSTSLNLYT